MKKKICKRIVSDYYTRNPESIQKLTWEEFHGLYRMFEHDITSDIWDLIQKEFRRRDKLGPHVSSTKRS